MMDKTLYTWEEMKQMYPDQWVLIANHKLDKGNFVHGAVLFACKDRDELHEFIMASQAALPYRIYTRYTGEPVDYAEYNDDVVLELYEEEVLC